MEKDILRGKTCQLLVIGGSAGSLEVVLEVLPLLERGLKFPVLIVMHRGGQGDDLGLIDLFSMKTLIPVKEVEDKDKAVPGNIYIAPKDYHLLCEMDGTFCLDASEKVNFSRPSIDVTFESAAEVYGSSLVVLLLSGANTDGTNGIKQVKSYGGTAIVQDPSTAKVPVMPQNAIEQSQVDYICTVEEIADIVNGFQ